MTRAVVVDDSHFMRTVISDVLESGGIDVVARATNGREAVDVVAKEEPDVVTMDVEMPTMNGIEAVEEIMETTPTPVLMLSAHTEEGAEATFEALDRGAIDVLAKPGGEVSTGISAHRDDLIEKVRSVARADVSVGPLDGPTPTTVEPNDTFVENATVVIGASTGGPRIVESVLAGLPQSAQLRILIVQHMPGGFTARFAKRLDDRTEYDVEEATDGERIGGGQALVAQGDYHMEVSNYAKGRLRVRLTRDDAKHGVRPAIDVTMKSAAETISDPLTAVVLTGMGADGAVGVKAIKNAGGRTIAQDEASCSVFGIPARAIETGCVDHVLPADGVARGILSAVRKPM